MAQALFGRGLDPDRPLIAVGDHPGPGAFDLADLAPWRNVDFDAAALPSRAVPGGKGGSRFDRVRGFGAVRGSPADYHVRAAHAARVKPRVIWTGDVEGDELVLAAAAADVDAIPVGVGERPRASRGGRFLWPRPRIRRRYLR